MAEYQLPQVSFCQIKDGLVASNPELATMASTVKRTHSTQPWSVYGSYTPVILQFTFPKEHDARKKEKRASLNSSKLLQPKFHLLQQPKFVSGTSQFRNPKRRSRSLLQWQKPSDVPVVDFSKIRTDVHSSFPYFALIPTRPHHPPEEFHLFKKLPPELQVEIWRYVLEDIGARVVTLRPEKTSIPGVVQACQVSRYEARKKFKFCVARQGFDRIYRFLDIENDVLHLPNSRIATVILEEIILPKGSWIWTFKNCLSEVTKLALHLDVADELVSTDKISTKTVSGIPFLVVA